MRRKHEKGVWDTILRVRPTLWRHQVNRVGGDAGVRDMLMLDTALRKFIRTARFLLLG